MSSANFNTVNIIQKIDRSSVESVKEAIFKRAQDKASSQVYENNKYNNDNFTKTVHNEVMSESVSRPSANPFAAGAFNTIGTTVSSEENSSNSAQKFSVNRKIQNSMTLQTGLYNSAMREAVMVQATESMTRNNDFNSNLSFLSNQTAIASYPAKQF